MLICVIPNINSFIGYLDLNEDDDFNSDLESLTEDEDLPVSKKQEKGTWSNYFIKCFLPCLFIT